jgi:hypothetical protein
MPTHSQGNGSGEKRIYVTLTGLPLSFELRWPFHKSTSGADFWVLHVDVRLENSPGWHALVAVNLSSTVREVMRSLEPKDAEGPVINTLRKEVDRRQIEFAKSGKLVPVHFSSRHYDFQRHKWLFGKASDEDIRLLVARTVYWQTRLAGGPVWVGAPADALYVQSSVAHMLETARLLAEQELLTLESEWASAKAALMAQAEKFESDMQLAVAELENKRAFERG